MNVKNKYDKSSFATNSCCIVGGVQPVKPNTMNHDYNGKGGLHYDVSSNISHKRKALKLSQEYVAEPLGVSRQAVSKWETKLSEPSTDNLIKLADLFACDIKELISPEKYLVFI